jgi:hypothetical protein
VKIRIEDLGEPELEFGGGERSIDPKQILPRVGPFDSTFDSTTKRISLGLVGLPSQINPARKWIERMHRPLVNNETNVQRFREFPGCEKAFRCRFEIPDRFVRRLDERFYDLISARNDHARFSDLLKLYGDAIKSFFSDPHPSCILVCFPEDVATLRITNPKLSYKEQVLLERLQKDEEVEQLSLFESSADEKKLASELLPQAEELLFRNFHRALKAECMMEQNAIPIQVMRRQTYVSEEAKQSDATRAWNLGLALYYKAGNIPWRPAGLTKDTCYVGISFHHLKRRSGDLVYASLAEAFSNDTEPFALKGTSIPRSQTRIKQPYLLEEQATALVEKVVDGYKRRVGSRPTRVVVHKTSHYQPEEQDGFRKGLLAQVAMCDLVWMAPTRFRLLRRGMREPLRGTLCTVEDRDHYLFTTGFVPWWSQYPGPHIPAPLEIGVAGETSIQDRAKEVLALTKMNWNSAEGIGRHPITMSFARRVGMIMTEIDEDKDPNPLYRFYM